MLGSLQILVGNEVVELGGRRQRLVLVLLLQRIGKPVPVDWLIDGVWGEAPPETARKTLQVYVSRLRKTLGVEVSIEAAPSGYILHASSASIDAVRFTELTEEGRRLFQEGDAHAAGEVLRGALNLWRGRPWGEFADEPLLRPDVVRLSELRAAAVELRIEVDLALGRSAVVVAELEDLIGGDPLRERLRALLMTALYRTGRQAEALRVFDNTRRHLASELGIEPSVELRHLHEQILRQDEALRPEPIADPGDHATGTAVRNPYKGLRSFTEEDAARFHGRGALISDLLDAVDGHPLVAVIGPSGSGKSSAVRAGLIPALRACALPGSEDWIIATFVPGAHPFEEFEAALLRAAPQAPASLREQMRGDDLDLVRAVLRVLPGEDGHVVVVIDQFEELFQLVDTDVCLRFLDNLVEAAEDPLSRLTLVTLVRADFLDRPMKHRRLGELLIQGMVSVLPLTPAELEQACAGPAASVEVSVEPGLAAELVTDVAAHPGALPLFQYALTELFDARVGESLTVEAYRRIGGLRGALVRRAEATWDQLDDDDRHVARQVFLRLVTVGEQGEETRRRPPRSELESLETDRGVVADVLERFGDARLLSFDRDAASGQPTVEVAHEALLREWPRMRGWIDDAREDLRMRRSLDAAVREWERADRDDDYLLSPNRLNLFASWHSTATFDLTSAEAAFLRASAERRDHEVAAELSRRAHELELERRSVARLRVLAVVLAVAALVATSLTVFAIDRNRDATRARDRALVATEIIRARELAAAAVAIRDTDPELSLLLALHAANISRLAGQPVPGDTVAAMHWGLQAAEIQYPVRDGPVAVLAGPVGPQGIYAMDLPDLVSHIQANVERTLTASECLQYLGVASCPQIPQPFPEDVAWQEPATAVDTATAGALAGTQVRMVGVGLDEVRLSADLQALTDRTGVTMTFDAEETAYEARLPVLIESQAVDLALIPQPGLIADLVRSGELMNFAAYLGVDELKRDFSPHLVDLGSFADQASEGIGVFAIPNFFHLKSMVWYPREAFEAAGYEVPTTWQGLVELVDRMVADGRTPWCHGEYNGEASGWPGTDWIEDLILHESGPEFYDAWARHEIPFTDPRVRRAFERFDEVVLAPGHVFGGRQTAASTFVPFASVPMFREPPGCWLAHMPSFTSANFPFGARAGEDVGAFPFPAFGQTDAVSVLGSGEMVVAFTDRPEVREVVRYLAGPQWGKSLVSSGEWYFPMHRGFPVEAFPTDAARELAEGLQDALDHNTFRFDASDLMPPEVFFAFWDAMVQFVGDESADLDALLEGIDAAWEEANRAD